MKTTMFLVTAMLIAFSLISCGGGGTGDGDGNGDLLLDNQLIASWIVISVMENGEMQPLGSTLEWPQGCTRQVYRLFDNGEAAVDSYAGNNLINAEYGDWTAQNQSGSIVFADETLNFDYMVYWSDNEPWTADFTYSENGHTYTARFVREANLTAHHADMVRTWYVRDDAVPSPLTLDGVESSVADYFDLPAGCDRMAIQFLADGTMVAREMDGYEVVTTDQGSWATGGASFSTMMNGVDTNGYFGNGGFEWTYVDPQLAQTVNIFWETWAADGNHPQELLGQWQAIDVTEDGTPIDLATFFGWDPGITMLIVEFWVDGTMENRAYAGSTLTERELGVWSVEGTSLRIQSVEYMEYDYSIVGTEATLTVMEGGHTYVLTFMQTD